MSKKMLVLAAIMAGTLLSPTTGRADRDGNDDANDVQGVWLCHSSRPGSSNRPNMQTYHRDGIFTITSGTNILTRADGSPRPYDDRSGLRGQWWKTGDGATYKAVELFYLNGQVNGRLFVEGAATLQSDGRLTTASTVTFTTFTYASGAIVKEDFEAPLQATGLCERLEDAFLVPFVP